MTRKSKQLTREEINQRLKEHTEKALIYGVQSAYNNYKDTYKRYLDSTCFDNNGVFTVMGSKDALDKAEEQLNTAVESLAKFKEDTKE